MKNFTLSFCALLLSGILLNAQTTIENVPQLCPNLSRAEKTIVAVSDFDNSASGAYWKIGNGMSDMLTNALVGCGCFRVVERDKLNSILVEQDLASQGIVNPNTAAQVGNMTGAQILVMGNITEFQEKVSGGAIGAISKKVGVGGIGRTKAHLGMILKLVDSSTGEILISKSLNHKTTKIGAVAGTSVLGVTVGGLFFKSKAMEDVVEKVIIEAVEIIAEQRNQLPPPTGFDSFLELKISNVDFDHYSSLRKMLESLDGVNIVGKNFSNNVAVYTLSLEMASDALAEKLSDAMDIEIIGFSDSTIEAKIH